MKNDSAKPTQVSGGAAPDQGAAEGRAGFVPLRLVLLPSGAAVDLTKPEVLLGRHGDADVRLPLPDVSRRHCRFVFSDGRWQVFDLNSLNGVFVNEQRIQRATLQHRDTIRIGGFTFEVDLQSRSKTVPLPTSGTADVVQEKRRAS